MFVEVIQEYNDSELGELLTVGHTMEVDEKRFGELIRAKVAKQIEQPAEEYTSRRKRRGDMYGSENGTDTE